MVRGKRLAVAGIFAPLVVAMFLRAAATEATYVTYVYAGDLQRLCSSDDNVAKPVCEGFISAGIEIVTNTPVNGFSTCVPNLTNLPAGIAITKKWLIAHHDEPTIPASVAVARALAEAFPCKK